ncbi:MAG: hypothetical protein LBV26_08595 [Bacteroidales bacterium]|jgi:hypothetical protein|nr:hypothetical protein [Bacteroidales bacterium]
MLYISSLEYKTFLIITKHHDPVARTNVQKLYIFATAAQTIANARLLASGIRKNGEGLAKRGIGEERAADIRIIKADAPQTIWKEFGIQAKK